MNPTCICGNSSFLPLSIIAMGVAFNSCCSRSPCWKNSSATSRAVCREVGKPKLTTCRWPFSRRCLSITAGHPVMESILFWEVYNYRLWCLIETCLLTWRRTLNQLSDHGRHAINKESDYRRPSKLENYAYSRRPDSKVFCLSQVFKVCKEVSAKRCLHICCIDLDRCQLRGVCIKLSSWHVSAYRI